MKHTASLMAARDRRFASTVLFLILSLLNPANVASASDAIFEDVGRVVSVGDLHGDYEQYISILKANGIVDKRLKWAADDAHFVQLGDVTDRGPDSLKIIRHLQKLEKQAKRKGGRVHVLIGNHEAMNIQTDLRYVHPGEYAALVTRRSDTLRERYIEAVFAAMVRQDPMLGEPAGAAKAKEQKIRLNSMFPAGYVEHRQLWEPGQELANWYASKPTVIRINDTLYLHGGLNPHAGDFPTLDEINQTISAELTSGHKEGLAVEPDGPLWYRGLCVHDAEQELEPLKAMLAFYGAEHIVVGHTPTGGAVMPRFDRRVVRADVGISAWYNRAQANLVQEGNSLSALHRGVMLDLPDDEGIEAYVAETLKLEPDDSRMARCVRKRSESTDTLEAAAAFGCKWKAE